MVTLRARSIVVTKVTSSPGAKHPDNRSAKDTGHRGRVKFARRGLASAAI